MVETNNDKDKNHLFELDLLSQPRLNKFKCLTRLLKRQHRWDVFSGIWHVESPGSLIYRIDPNVRTGENISVIGSPKWADFIFHVNFKILTKSIKPPEGGIILYFYFKNIRNYYSVHFCLFKQKIEFMKRLRGAWYTIAEESYELQTNKEYRVIINTVSNFYQFKIDGISLIRNRNTDISIGRVGIGVKYCDAEFTKLSVSIPKTG
jgi:hypothetical protein